MNDETYENLTDAQRLEALRELDAGKWYSTRVEHEDGDIQYEAFGVRGSHIFFTGGNARQDCETFMKAVGEKFHG